MNVSICDPWSGEPVGSAPLLEPSGADGVVARCVRGYAAMRQMATYQRRDLLRSIAVGIRDKGDALAELMAREAGKPIALGRGEVARAVSTFELGAEEAVRMGGEVLPLDLTETSRGFQGHWRRVPRGPVIAISPFNFPLNLVAHKIAPALACGASIVLKPAPQTPLTALALLEIIRAAGAPEDAVQVVPCSNEVAESLVKDERFLTFSFTGSAAVGWRLKGVAGKKRVLLELGGNAAAIVHSDAPKLADVSGRIAESAFAYAGQVCIKTQRLYVHRPIADAFVKELVERARAMKPEMPLTAKGTVGPLIDAKSAERVETWVRQAEQGGARVVVGGKREGNRFEPTVVEINGEGHGLKVVDEEVFGPVLTVHRYDEWGEALEMANATRYGLQAGIFTDSRTRIDEAFEKLDVGGLIVGNTATFRVDAMPYGGMKDSGLGREGVRFAMEEMTDRKLIVYAAT